VVAALACLHGGAQWWSLQGVAAQVAVQAAPHVSWMPARSDGADLQSNWWPAGLSCAQISDPSTDPFQF